METPTSPRRASIKIQQQDITGAISSNKPSNSPRRTSQIFTEIGVTRSRTRSISLAQRSTSFDLKSALLEQDETVSETSESAAKASSPGRKRVISVLEYNEDSKETRILSPIALNSSSSFDNIKSFRSPLIQYRKEDHRHVVYKRFCPYLTDFGSEDYGTTYKTYLLVNPDSWDANETPTSMSPGGGRFSGYSSMQFPKTTTYKTYKISTCKQTGKKHVTTFTHRYNPGIASPLGA